MDETAGHPVQFGPGHLQQRKRVLGRELEDVAEPVVALRALGDVGLLHGQPGVEGLQPEPCTKGFKAVLAAPRRPHNN